jgi:hypothetical protein
MPKTIKTGAPRPIRERDIEKYLVARVKELGGQIRKVKWIGHNSAPDRLVLLPGRRPFLLELKAPGRKPTLNQRREILRLMSFNMPASWADSFRTVDYFIDLVRPEPES